MYKEKENSSSYSREKVNKTGKCCKMKCDIMKAVLDNWPGLHIALWGGATVQKASRSCSPDHCSPNFNVGPSCLRVLLNACAGSVGLHLWPHFWPAGRTWHSEAPRCASDPNAQRQGGSPIESGCCRVMLQSPPASRWRFLTSWLRKDT